MTGGGLARGDDSGKMDGEPRARFVMQREASAIDAVDRPRDTHTNAGYAMDARRTVQGPIDGAASVKALVGAFVESQGGFVRHKRGYFRHHPEVIQVVSLEWDALFARYLFKVALFVRTARYPWATAREPVDLEFPQQHLCHLSLDTRNLIPDAYEPVEKVLSLPGELADAAPTLAPLRDFLHDRVAPFLSMSSSLAGLRQLRSQDAFQGARIHPDLARDLH